MIMNWLLKHTHFYSKMASSLKAAHSHGSVEIYYDQTLGIGSYGSVCRAKCGQLSCAAKVLHNTLFQFSSEVGTHDSVEKFERECHFLSSIKHPNIVQHLATVNDPKSGRPVLLMEMMDENLTEFLKQTTPGLLPYHCQVNISHDIALALAYLHLNGIIHRDLSSNNVLLIGAGSRAKVTDFGMYKLIDVNPYMSPLNQTPGTLAYMPPEVLLTPPVYSTKLDCFSYGVLMVQIITGNYPDPGNANKYIEDTKYPTGRVVVQFPEIERRKKDIDQIEPHHPLLSMALKCLKDRDNERPLADELCQHLATLKADNKYAQSIKDVKDPRESIQQLEQQLKIKDELLNQCQGQIQSKVEEHNEEVEALRSELKKKEEVIEEYRVQLQSKEEVEALRSELKKKEEMIKEYRVQLKEEAEEISEDCVDTNDKADSIEKVSDDVVVMETNSNYEQEQEESGSIQSQSKEEEESKATPVSECEYLCSYQRCKKNGLANIRLRVMHIRLYYSVRVREGRDGGEREGRKDFLL